MATDAVESFSLLDAIELTGYEYVDKRYSGGCLWIIAAKRFEVFCLYATLAESFTFRAKAVVPLTAGARGGLQQNLCHWTICQWIWQETSCQNSANRKLIRQYKKQQMI